MLLSKAANSILKVEEQNNLLYTYKYNGVPVWEITRYPIFKTLENQLSGGPKSKLNFRSIISSFNSLILLNPFFYLSRKNVLIFRCSRKNMFNGDWIDLFTKNLETKYSPGEYGIYETELSVHNKLERNPYSGLIKKISLRLSLFFYKFYKPSNDVILEIAGILKKEDINVNYKALFAKEYLRFKIECFLYKFILKFRKPKIIYLVNYIDKLALIFVAKRMNIQVHELQHGFTAPSLILYHYPYSTEDNVSTFPTHFHYVSEEYICGCKIPVNKENLFWNQSPYLINRNVITSTPADKDSVLFVSQHLLHQPFFEFLKEFCRLNTATGLNMKIYFKPHPAEYKMLDHAELDNLKMNFGLHFLDQSSNIYQAIANVKNVVGVYSTVLLEAKNAGCSVFLIDIEGVGHFSALIDKYNIPVFKDAEDMVNYFQLQINTL